jgi:hypothetical protein
MWISKKKLEEMLSGDESVLVLMGQIRKLKDELAELKTTKKMEEREIEHLVKIKEEKLNIEHQKREVQLQKEFQKKEMDLQTKYHDKIMAKIEDARKEQQGTYKEIMKRLPNVNVRLGDK